MRFFFLFCVCVAEFYKMFIKCSTDMDFDCLFIMFRFQKDASPVIHIQKNLNPLHVVTGGGEFASSQSRRWWLHQKKFCSHLAKLFLSLSLLLDFQLLAENRGDLARHEGPRYARVGQRTLLAWWAVDFSTGSLKEMNEWCHESYTRKTSFCLLLTCRLMLSRLHGKQNLWWATDGHWTKWVSSNRSWQIVPANWVIK